MIGCGSDPAEAEKDSTGGTQDQEVSQELRQRLREFTKDPAARASVEELEVPVGLAARIDLDEDGDVTAREASQFMQRSSGPRDRSDFTMLREEGFPLNSDPTIVPADEAPIGDEDMVMGVVINGEARAYPVNYMNGPTNEVVNDTLGGEAISPSW